MMTKLIAFLFVLLLPSGRAFHSQPSLQQLPPRAFFPTRLNGPAHSRPFLLHQSSSNNPDQKQEPKPPQQYSRQVILREEAESPFRKVRFFVYASLGGGALISFIVSATRVLAALNGINVDLMEESLLNVGVDVGGLVVLGFLYQQDLKAQDSRRKRASKGAELAKLMIRAPKRLQDPLIAPRSTETTNQEYFTTSLSSLRRGRGIEKRVVIAAARAEKIDQVLEETKQLDEAFQDTDLVLVPVVIPGCTAPNVEDRQLADCVALPVGNGWKAVIEDELNEAIMQGVNVDEKGFCVVLKKNGRVGQRTSGIPLRQLVGDVVQRKAIGLDVTNI